MEFTGTEKVSLDSPKNLRLVLILPDRCAYYSGPVLSDT